jgi:hypothetical protein
VYCPVDGDEYVEGITRCPEHDVDLVEQPPEIDDSTGWATGTYERLGLRIALAVVVVAAIVHAVAGAAAAVISGSRAAFEGDVTRALLLGDVAEAAFRVLIGATGVLGGALLFRTYAKVGSWTDDEAAPDADVASPTRTSRGLSTEIMRILFALVVVFTLLWVGTGVATAADNAEYFARVFGGGMAETPPQSFVTLSTLHTVAYFGGVACLAIMGALLSLRAYERVNARAASS